MGTTAAFGRQRGRAVLASRPSARRRTVRGVAQRKMSTWVAEVRRGRASRTAPSTRAFRHPSLTGWESKHSEARIRASSIPVRPLVGTRSASNTQVPPRERREGHSVRSTARTHRDQSAAAPPKGEGTCVRGTIKGAAARGTRRSDTSLARDPPRTLVPWLPSMEPQAPPRPRADQSVRTKSTAAAHRRSSCSS